MAILDFTTDLLMEYAKFSGAIVGIRDMAKRQIIREEEVVALLDTAIENLAARIKQVTDKKG